MSKDQSETTTTTTKHRKFTLPFGRRSAKDSDQNNNNNNNNADDDNINNDNMTKLRGFMNLGRTSLTRERRGTAGGEAKKVPLRMTTSDEDRR